MPAAWIRIRRLVAGAALAATLADCGGLYDAATAIAYDIEDQVAAFERSGRPAATLTHRPDPERGGCPGLYRVQFSRASSLVVWCRDPQDPTRTVSSHTTTFHLRFVDVPRTTVVDKGAGTSLAIDVVRSNGKPTVTRVY